MKLIALLLTTWLAMGSCDKPTALSEFSSGNLKFTSRLYNEILKEKPGQNFVFSPFSIEVVLALTRAGAKGRTHQEFTSALNLPSEEVTNKALKQFLPLLKKSSEDLQLSTANKLYVSEKLQILDGFKNLATSVYDAGIENLDFTKNVQAAETINRWVEERTNNKIQNVVNPELITNLTRLVLVNALHFKGTWENEFSYVEKQPFYTSKTQTKNVDMMSVEATFRYYESPSLKAQFLELPYRGGDISMTIVLPREIDGLAALENNVELLLAPQNLKYQGVSVKLPSFLVESDYELKPILKKLGLNDAFLDADFSGISNDPLVVSEVVQKAFINVTKTGTEAAAATVAYGVALSATITNQQPIPFSADHPFVYYIKYGELLLFSGRITHPKLLLL